MVDFSIKSCFINLLHGEEHGLKSGKTSPSLPMAETEPMFLVFDLSFLFVGFPGNAQLLFGREVVLCVFGPNLWFEYFAKLLPALTCVQVLQLPQGVHKGATLIMLWSATKRHADRRIARKLQKFRKLGSNPATDIAKFHPPPGNRLTKIQVHVTLFCQNERLGAPPRNEKLQALPDADVVSQSFKP